MLWLRLKLNYLKNGSEYQIMHLREIVTIFSTIFLLKDSIWVPYEQAKTVSQTFSFSRRYVGIRSQSSKITFLHNQRLLRHLNFSLDTKVFIFINYCYWVCKNTQEPFFTCSLKICEKSSKISASVRIVLSSSA